MPAAPALPTPTRPARGSGTGHDIGHPASPRTLARRRLARFGPPLAIAVLAFLTRLVPVLRGGGLAGRETYDPFVYYGSAVALSTGHLPYRDFLLLHPPVITLVLTPFALLGRLMGDPVGIAVARLAFMALGAASAALVFVILRRRGLVAAVAGSCLYAVWFPAYYVEHDLRLEAVAGFLLLAGLLAVERLESSRQLRWAAAAGALVGLTVAVKLWGLVPLGVLLVWLLMYHGVRAAAVALAAAGGLVAAIIAPFAVAAPRLLQLIVTDQLGRPRSAADWQFRLLSILGLGPVPAPAATACLVVACGLAVVALVLAVRKATGMLHAGLAVSSAAVLIATPMWYAHYPAFAAAPLCLLFGNATGVILPRVRTRQVRTAALIALVSVLLAGQVALLSHAAGRRFPTEKLSAVLDHRPGCVTSDRTSALVLTGALRCNIARECPIVVDILGYKFAGQAHDASPAQTQRRFQTLLLNYLGSGSTAVMVNMLPKDYEPTIRAHLRSWPLVGSAGRIQVREPR